MWYSVRRRTWMEPLIIMFIGERLTTTNDARLVRLSLVILAVIVMTIMVSQLNVYQFISQPLLNDQRPSAFQYCLWDSQRLRKWDSTWTVGRTICRKLLVKRKLVIGLTCLNYLDNALQNTLIVVIVVFEWIFLILFLIYNDQWWFLITFPQSFTNLIYHSSVHPKQTSVTMGIVFRRPVK